MVPRSAKKDVPPTDLPEAPSLAGGDGGNNNGGPEEPKSDENKRTWKDNVDDAITIGAAIIISLGIRTCVKAACVCSNACLWFPKPAPHVTWPQQGELRASEGEWSCPTCMA